MAISRAQMYRQLKKKGGITNLIEPRQQYGLGSLVKSITKPIKKAASAIGDFASSDVGKMALLAAGGYYLGGGAFGGLRAGAPGFTFGRLGTALASPFAGLGGGGVDRLAFNAARTAGTKTGMGVLGKAGLALAGGTALAALAGGVEEGDAEAIAASRDVNALKGYLRSYYENLGYEPQAIERLVARDTKEYSEGQGGYAKGGRVNFEDGGTFLTLEEAQERDPGMFVNEGGDEMSPLMQLLQKYYTFKEAAPGVGQQTREFMYNTIKEEAGKQGIEVNELVRFAEEQAPIYAPREEKMGGGMPTGIMRTNQAGVMERDYREEGGFVPVGIKEKADDVPAMLSKNEFVMTADAVRGAGNGDVEKGAQRMYKVMKTLENGGTV